ncbi:esterase-like activity of phytase family protein [Capilliphycus salinus ALCB114379]|uniref:esterase-like activity of phytase family protein n=1 Tax=Capilliphycus salinus TaxID=2768948 RepID=UPI0039A5ACFD
MKVNAIKVLIFICGWVIFISIFINQPKNTLSTENGFDFIGKATFPTGFLFQQTEVGGLSGISYNPDRQVYYAISDDRSSKAPARFYTLKIDLSSDQLLENGVEIIDETTLLNSAGEPFPEMSLDTEGIAFTGESVFVSSEGDVKRLQPPFIKEFSLDGQELRSFPIPDKFLPTSEESKRGIRNNLALESLTQTPDKRYLFTATENALVQDGKAATPAEGSPCRILRYNLQTGQPDQEFLYITDPIVTAPRFPSTFQINGLVDLLAIDENHLLALERSFAIGVGNTIKFFQVSLEAADRIQGLDRLKGEIGDLSPVRKTLLLNLSTLNFPVDNIEGLTFGPTLSDGRRSLILVSDNNFNALQITQILALAVDDNTLHDKD